MSTRHNLIANFAGQGWVAVVSLAFIPIYIEYLGMEAYGLIGFFALLQGWLAALDMGLTPTLSREMARYAAGQHQARDVVEIFTSIETVFLVIAGLIALGLMALAGVIAGSWLQASQLNLSSITTALMTIAWLIAFRWLAGLYKGAINGLQHQVWLNVCMAGFATVRAVGVLAVLHWISRSIEAFFLYQCLMTLVEAAVLRGRLISYLPTVVPPARPSLAALAKIWKFAGGMLLITALATLLTQVDKLMLSRMLTLGAFGGYALASALAMTLCALAGLVFTAVYPRLTGLVTQVDESTVAAHYHQYAQLLSMVTIPPALVLAFFADRVVFVWTGDHKLTTEVAPLLSILALGSLFNAMMYLPYSLQLAYGWTRFAVNMNLISVLVLVPATYWGVSQHGSMAAAWVWMVLNLGYLVVGVPLMHRRLLRGELARWYQLDIGLPLLAGSLVMGAAFFWVRGTALEPRGEGLALVVVAGTLCTLATVWSTAVGREMARGAMKTGRLASPR